MDHSVSLLALLFDLIKMNLITWMVNLSNDQNFEILFHDSYIKNITENCKLTNYSKFNTMDMHYVATNTRKYSL